MNKADFSILRLSTNRTLRAHFRQNKIKRRMLAGMVRERLQIERSTSVQLAKFLEDAPVGCHFLNNDGLIVWANSTWSRMTGYAKNELFGKHYADLIHPSERGQAEERRLKKLSGEQIESILERTYLHKNGSPLNIVSYDSTLEDEEGKVIGTRTILVDVSQRKKLEQQVFELKRKEDLGILAEGVAHEFNNLTAAIQIAVSQIKKRNGQLKGETLLLLDIIEEQCLHAKTLTKDIQTYAAINGLMLNELEPEGLVRETVDNLRHLPEPDLGPVEYIFDFKSSYEILADQVQTFQAIYNILTNARDALTDRLSITIRVKDVEFIAKKRTRSGQILAPGKYVAIQVEDQGEGISPSIEQKMFAPFFTTKPPQKGTGIGLPMTLGIMESHKGAVDFESWPGKGSTFILYFPAVEKN